MLPRFAVCSLYGFVYFKNKKGMKDYYEVRTDTKGCSENKKTAG